MSELKDLRLPGKLSDFLQKLLSDVDGKTRPSVSNLLKHGWVQDEDGAKFSPSNPKMKRRLSSKNSPMLVNKGGRGPEKR